jgi:hypothetical protein
LIFLKPCLAFSTEEEGGREGGRTEEEGAAEAEGGRPAAFWEK